MFNFGFYPFIGYGFLTNPNKHQITNDPPTLYSIMNAMVNFNKEESEKVKIKDLAKNCYQEIFYDLPNYGLDPSINPEKILCNILNHYLMRRINFETFNAFLIQLNVKMIEISPIINSLFLALNKFSLFDGRNTERNLTDDTTSNNVSDITTNTKTEQTSDNRYSDTPQNNINDVKNGNYMTDYTYNKINASGNGTQKNTDNKTDNKIVVESIHEDNPDKIDILLKLQNDLQSVYKYIYKNLDPLFFGISDY